MTEVQMDPKVDDPARIYRVVVPDLRAFGLGGEPLTREGPG